MTVRRFVRFTLAGAILAYTWFALSAIALHNPNAPALVVSAMVLLMILLVGLTRSRPVNRDN